MIATSKARRIVGAGTLLVALAVAAPAQPHMATERYIPLGQSPGVSHNFTVVGKIEAVDQANRSVTVATPSETVTVPVTAKSRIWVDRSKLKQTSLKGGFADLVQGRTIEVKFVNPTRKQVVDWIKVEAAAAP